jgi:hypothetical protein
MLRWILLLLAIGCIYWIYQRDSSPPPQWQTTSPGPTLPPGGRLGGGLNPFVTDTDIDAPPQRP